MHYVEPLIGIVNWRYDRATGRLSLLHDSAVVHKLEPRLHHLLNYFLQHPAQIISKDQLMDDVWPEGEGTDAAVMRAIASLRKILQPGLADQACIETLSKRGYRWLLPIEELSSESIDKVALQRPAETEAVTFPAAAPLDLSKIELVTKPHSTIEPANTNRKQLTLLGFLVLLGLVAFAYFMFQTRPQPDKVSDVYSQQLTISALAGNELSPLLTADQSHLLYHYQLPPQNKWRWLSHDLSNNRQQSGSQAFDKLGQAIWLDANKFLFQGQIEQKCHFFIQSFTKLHQQATQVYPCDGMVRHGLVKRQHDIFWLAVAEDQSIQLWQRAADDFKQTTSSQAKLVYQFEKGYRRALQVLSHQGHLYVLVEKDFASTSLFQVSPEQGDTVWLKDFHLPITHLAGWHGKRLLLATSQGPMLYALKEGLLHRLDTAQGLYNELYPQPQQILAVSLLDATADILPLQLAKTKQKPQVFQWLNSNKNEYQLVALSDDPEQGIVGKIAFVSERSGTAQVWLQQQDKLQQLTNLTTPAKISQLLWHQDQLFALINGNVAEINLTDGKINTVQIGTASRVLSCQQQLYWTSWSATGWALFRLEAERQPEKIRDGVVDARCAPDGQLVLLPFAQGPLQLWQPGAAESSALPVSLSWREQSADSWLTNKKGLFWLENNSLRRFDWTQQQILPIQTLQPFSATEIYPGNQDEEIYYKKINDLQADVIWLKPAA
jgi:DNA-binding winged helix-turn-helix (wHTH) protein